MITQTVLIVAVITAWCSGAICGWLYLRQKIASGNYIVNALDRDT